MTNAILKPIDPRTLAARLKAGDVTLVDIRERDEFARERIPGALSMPLSALTKAHLALEPRGDVVFHCKSGMRTSANCAQLAQHVDGPAFMLDGGLEAWRKAGLALEADRKAPLELMRQVQIAIGLLILTGVALALTVDPLFVLAPAVFGAGLLFAGATGWCGMAKLLALAPWNRRRAA